MKLKTDIKSAVNPKKVYGYQGEEVQLYSEHGNVLIVTKMNNERIYVHRSNVTEEPVEVKKEIITVPDATVQNKIKEQVSRKKAVPINQKTLF